jgi:hypothetical protein
MTTCPRISAQGSDLPMASARWTVGTNLFSGWRDETEAKQREKWRLIKDYEEVKDGFLLEGVWSRDPETRRRELETYNYETAVAEVKAEIAS